MRKSPVLRLLALLAALFLAQPAPAAAEEGKVLRETWYESRTELGKLGHLHCVAVEVERDGRKLIHTTIREEISYLRSGDPYSESQEHDTLETPDGRIVELGYRTNLSKKQQLRLRGRPEKDRLTLHVIGDDGKPTRFQQTIPWDEAALGLYAQDCFFEGKKLQPGQTLDIKSFSVSANRVVPTRFIVKSLKVLEQSYPKEWYLDPATLSLNDQGLVVKMEQKTSLFGAVIYDLTAKEKATAPFKATVADIEAPILVNKPIPFKQGSPKELIVRVAMEGEDEPGTLFARDGRQVVVKADREAVELRLLARAPAPRAADEGKAPAAEYLESSFFIRSDDEDVRKLARRIAGDESEPRRQLRLIRKWIQEHFQGNYEVAFATADELARNPEGDCSEMGVLAAALCRALNIPSRVVFGLVYDPGNPGFGGHLWIEVHVDGRWQPFDPTGVVNLVGAAYIKVADYSLKDILNPDELVGVRRAFAGKMKVDIVEVK